MYKRILMMFTLLMALTFVLLSIDLVNTNITYSELDNLASEVGFYISKNGGINETIKNYVKKEMNATIKCPDDQCIKPKVGDTYFYILTKEFNPIILKTQNKISIKRSVIINE